MHYVAIITVLALLQFSWFGILVARARSKYKITAPAITGNENFERQFRVQMNTLEQLIIFLPALWMFAFYVDAYWAAGLGVVFLIGRFIYASTYVRDPKSRAMGFALTAVPNFTLLAGAVFGAVKGLIAGD